MSGLCYYNCSVLQAKSNTAQKVSKYKVFSDPYFPVFSPNTRKYGLEKTPYVGSFHAVQKLWLEDWVLKSYKLLYTFFPEVTWLMPSSQVA